MHVDGDVRVKGDTQFHGILILLHLQHGASIMELDVQDFKERK
jgi:hypothetical protein